jgi:endonuclease/exonuclease/phosphatase family metal-dependent hydrolase
MFSIIKPVSRRSLFVCFLIAAALFPAREAAAASVRAMTFNVRCPCGDVGQYAWDARKAIVVDMFKKYKADFVGTQENVAAYQTYLKAQLPEYAFFGRGRDRDGGGEGTQIFYLKDRWEIVPGDSGTFQMSATPEVWGSVSWSSLPRVTTWALFREKATGKRLYVYNTHWDHQTGRDQFSWMTADTLANRKYKDIPVLLMGDFNQTQSTNPIKYLLGQDVYPARDPVVKLADTHPAVIKIDHVLIWPSPGNVDSLPMNVVEARVLADRYTVGQWTNVSPSDHNPTLVELKVWKDNVAALATGGSKSSASRASRASRSLPAPIRALEDGRKIRLPDGRAL